LNYNVDQIAQITNGQITGIKPELVIQNICFDTRTIRSPKNSLFLALKTENDNGHKYISEAINQGIQLIICEIENKEANTTSCQIIVKNSLVALQKLAAYHRAQFDLPVIGITGSYGKTIVKEWLHSLLNKKYAIVKSPRSYNSQLGTAISVLNIAKDHNLGIFEAGISKTNEMESLQNMIQPNIGLITR